jgi:hypothetical protein
MYILLTKGGKLDLPLDSGTAELLCGVHTSNPNAVFTWLKDGRHIDRTPIFYKDDGRVLVIPDFKPSDNGEYECVTNDEVLSSATTALKYISPGHKSLC